MENEKRVRIISLVAVIVAVIGLTLAFAAMSRTLKINGRGSVDPANFDIYFDNLSNPVTNGQAQTSGTPTLATKGAEISNIKVTLKQPKDSVAYTVDIVNEGDVDAEISNITLPTLTNRENELFEFTAEYTSEQENGSKTISVGDMLYKNERKNITITFKYKDITDESKLPNNPEEITLSYAIEYVQSNRTKTTTESGSSSNYGEEIASKQISENITATYYGGTPIAKASAGVMAMSNDNKLADDVRYQGGTLVISGSGAMPDNEEANFDLLLFLWNVSSLEEAMNNLDKYYDESTGAYILKYNPTNLIIEEGITQIGNYSFSGIGTIINVSLSSTVTTIGVRAFENVPIVNMKLVGNIRTIGEGAFYNCKYLKTLYVGNNIKEIGRDAFNGVSADNAYFETQEVRNLFNGATGGSFSNVIIDPTRFN